MVSNKYICIVFFQQETTYEMRISDWSSDVCSSDLRPLARTRSDSGGDAGRYGGIGRHRARGLQQARPAGTADQDSPVEHCGAGREPGAGRPFGRGGPRSEEHTSELQSLMRISYAVFCLKKKKKNSKLTHMTKPRQ